MRTVDVPETVRTFARAAGAEDWLAGLPELVDRLERDWDIAIGSAFTQATEAYVAAATLSDGTPAVVKVLIRDRARALAARTGTDPVAIMEWGDLERVANGLLCLETGLPDPGRVSMAAADRIAGLRAGGSG